jgi:hypothetical protein
MQPDLLATTLVSWNLIQCCTVPLHLSHAPVKLFQHPFPLNFSGIYPVYFSVPPHRKGQETLPYRKAIFCVFIHFGSQNSRQILIKSDVGYQHKIFSTQNIFKKISSYFFFIHRTPTLHMDMYNESERIEMKFA